MCNLRRTLANTYGNHPTSGSSRLQRCFVFRRSQVQTRRKSILTKFFYFSSIVPDEYQDNTSRWSTTTSFLHSVQFIIHYQNIREAGGRWSADARLLGLRSRIPPGAWMSVVSVVIRCNNPLHLQWTGRRGRTEKGRKKEEKNDIRASDSIVEGTINQ